MDGRCKMIHEELKFEPFVGLQSASQRDRDTQGTVRVVRRGLFD